MRVLFRSQSLLCPEILLLRIGNLRNHHAGWSRVLLLHAGLRRVLLLLHVLLLRRMHKHMWYRSLRLVLVLLVFRLRLVLVLLVFRLMLVLVLLMLVLLVLMLLRLLVLLLLLSLLLLLLLLIFVLLLVPL